MPPSVLLHHPHIAQNLGSVARVMANFGLADLRLIAPRCDPADPLAVSVAAAGAGVLAAARVYPDLDAAAADLQHLYATTALDRALPLPRLHPRVLAGELRARDRRRVGLLFGPEPHGLDYEALARADAVVSIPTDPGCRALNLAQAVCVCAWEWAAAGALPPPTAPAPAPRAEFERFLSRLYLRLDAVGWAAEPGLRARVRRNLRCTLRRAGPTRAELHTLAGVVEALGRP